MTAYRDDLEAALARNADLERRVRELEAAAEEDDEADEEVRTLPPSPSVLPGVNEIDKLVDRHQREVDAARTRWQARARRSRERAIARHARRRDRVSVTRLPDATRITIARMPLRSALWSQFGWGFCFAAVNPGFVVVFALGALFVQRGLSMWLALPVWLVLLTLCNIVYARIRRRARVLDLTPEGNFALHRGNPRWASHLGRTEELRVRLDADPDPAFLHEVELADVEIEKLTARDVRALGATLARHGATR